MTNNIFIKCDVCGSIIDLKWQIGYLKKSVFRVNCGRCKTVIEGTLYTNDNPGFSYEIKNATEIKAKLDFDCDYIIPISGEILTEKMRNGDEQFKPTPFINIVSLVGVEKFSIFNARFLNGMNQIEKLKNKCDRINELYVNKEYKYLKKMITEDFNVKRKKWDTRKILEEKYNIDLKFYNSFVNPKKYLILKEKIFKNYKKIKAISKLDYENLLNFLENDVDKFEKRIRDILNLFLENYNSFIPVLLLEYVDKIKINEIYDKYAITTVHFEDVRNLYLRIYENIIDVSTVFVGLNNIMYRGNYQKIDDTIINKKNTIQDYKEMSKGNKIKYLTQNEIFNLLIPKFDKDIRNAIGHEDIEYDTFSQKLKYDDKEMYLMEYVFNIWKCYELCLLMYDLVLNIKLDILRKNSKGKA